MRLTRFKDTVRYMALLAYWRNESNLLLSLRGRLADKTLHHTSVIVNHIGKDNSQEEQGPRVHQVAKVADIIAWIMYT